MIPIVTTAKHFTFTSYSFDRTSGEVVLTYAIDGEEFVERLVFPIPATGIPEGIDTALDRALFTLHIIAGISYYKAKLPPEIVVESGKLSVDQASFWNKLYTLGLGEFFYRNGLDFLEYIQFPASDQSTSNVQRPTACIPSGALVPIGGGKDSLVAIEMLREAGIDFDLVMFGHHSRIREVAAEVGKPLMQIQRTIDPKLMELNAAGAWNGHVPITAYVGIASMIVALLHGKRDVVFANERSANTGNAEFEGIMINHQYSKSLEAERDLQQYLSAFVTQDVRVFSILRPMSELDIARRFAANGKYFGVFSSCNKNFKQGGVPSVTRWCGKCPKCAFVFVMLGAFISRRKMVEMFSEDVLMKPELLAMYKDLTGYGTMKPFECVGEFEEVIAALALIEGRGEYDDSPIMKWFAAEVSSKRNDIDALINHARTLSMEHAMPEEYAHMVYASR